MKAGRRMRSNAATALDPTPAASGVQSESWPHTQPQPCWARGHIAHSARQTMILNSAPAAHDAGYAHMVREYGPAIASGRCATAKTAAITVASYRRKTTRLEHRPRGQPLLDRSGRF